MCFVQGQGQKREEKHTAKNFAGFHNHSPLLTMVKLIGKARELKSKEKCHELRMCEVSMETWKVQADFFKFEFSKFKMGSTSGVRCGVWTVKNSLCY